MVLTLLLQVALAEEAAQMTESVEPPQQVLLYSGTDAEASLIRTAFASGIAAENFSLQTIVDLTTAQSPTYISQRGDERIAEGISGCSGSRITNKHVQNYTQTADHHLNYYELEKSSEALQKAESSLICLNELFNADDVRKMYYLKGILEQTKGNNEASTAAFSSAIRIKPDLQWNNIYSPDAKPNFDAAKSGYSALKSVPLIITPAEAASSLWINGTPLLDVDNPSMFSGNNIIQVVGLDTTTYEITIPDDVDSIQLILPSALPNNAYMWAEDETKAAELNTVIGSFLPTDTALYMHNAGKVWTTQLDSNKWTELEVPKFAEAKLNAKKITGQTLMWTGLATTAVSIGLSANYYVKGETAYQASTSTTDWETFKGFRSDLNTLESQYNASMLTAIGGLGLAAIGYTVAF